MDHERKKMIVILNARAGTASSGARAGLEPRIAELFGDAGLEPVIIVAPGKDLTAAAKQALAGDPKTIIAAGGDGTVSAVAGEAAGTNSVLGVLPVGTLNHFAKDLHIPLQLRSAIRTVVDHHVIPIDVGEVNGRVFINNSSLGIYSQIVRRRITEQKHHPFLHKASAFVWASLQVFRRFPFYDLRIEVEGKTLRRKTAFLFVGNNEYHKIGFRIGARARIDTGKLGLYLAHPVGRWGLIHMGVRAVLAHLQQERDFEGHMVSEAFINSRRRSILIACDGEVTTMKFPLHYRCRHRALRVIAPRNSAG